MSHDEAYERIGYCELYETEDILRKLDYWCPSYLKKEEQVPVKKLVQIIISYRNIPFLVYNRLTN